MGVVLASGSPRRLELLRMVGLKDFKVIPDKSKEEINASLSPELTVQAVASQKAKNISHLCENNDIIIAADTLVYLDGHPLGKPDGPDIAAEMLKKLSGRRHSVYTGVALLRNATCTTAVERTDVFFREISEDEISQYVKSGEPMDKAGAYAAQGRGAIFVKRIEGDFFNVMGLPLYRLAMMLREFGVVL
ncbi:MAG: Maf family protein [Oscillospiraceae bacterium]|nr:Maf family protein [Oscillospiraceae bacterium]